MSMTWNGYFFERVGREGRDAHLCIEDELDTFLILDDVLANILSRDIIRTLSYLGT
jgi:hypothetical protein